MLHWIIELSLRFKPIIIALAIAIVGIGLIQLKTMPVDALPEFAPPYIEIQTEAPGLSVSEVEELVTFNLEELLNGTPWLDNIRSTSVSGLSSLVLTFKPGTDLMRARQLVSERLGLTYALPNVAQPPVILQPLSATSRVMMIGLSSEKIPLIDMSVLAHWNIRPALLSIPGVANVAIWGLRDKQMQVLVNPEILQKNKVQLNQIIGTTGNALWVSPLSFLNASTPGSGGWIESPQQRIEVAHTLAITTPKDLIQVIVENSTFQLGQLTHIVEDHPPLIGDAILNSDSPGLLIVIDKFPGANTLDVTRNVESKLRELQPGLNGIQIDTTIFRPVTFVETVIYNTILAFAIIICVLMMTLFIFTYAWRTVVLCIITVPVALMLTIILLNLFHQTINVMVILGLMISMIIMIDDAIIAVTRLTDEIAKKSIENIRKDTFILKITWQTGRSMMFALFILILILIPVFFLKGLAKDFFEPVAITLILALFSSTLITLTITPTLAFLFYANESISLKKSMAENYLHHLYDNAIHWFFRKTTMKTIAIIALLGGVFTFVSFIGLLTTKTLPTIPDFQESNIIIKWEGPPGTSIDEMDRMIKLVNHELTKIPGVINVAANIGRTALGDQIVNVNSAEIIVNVNTEENYATTINKIKNIVHGYPGIFHVVQTYLKQKTRQASTGSTSDALIRVFGPHLDVLRQKSEEIQQKLHKIPGIIDIHIEQQVEEPQIAVEVNLAQAQKYGLKPGDIRRAAATIIAGINAGTIFQDQKTFQVVVWGTPNTRHSLESLKRLLIDTPDGKTVKLSDVASVSVVATPNFIKHDAVSRRIDVGFNMKNRNQTEVINDVNHMLTQIKFPLEFRAKLVGAEQTNFYSYFNYSCLVLIFIAILIYLILQSALGNFLFATVIFFSLPLALLGSLIAIFCFSSISLASLFGLFVVLSMTIRHVILMIQHYQKIDEPNKDMAFVIRESHTAFTATFISFSAVGISLLPILFFVEAGGLEIIIPMFIIILCGFVTSAIFCLFITPSLYLYYGVPHSGRRKSDVAL